MTEKINLSKKELIKLLEQYDDEKLICFSVKLQQGTVGFLDITLDENKSNGEYIVLKSQGLNEWYNGDIQELKNEERSREHCLNYTGKPKCHYTGEICDDDFVQICEEYRSDEGTYPCPYCNRTGLKLMDYGSDKVWECMRCGAELWNCETIEEMQKRCEEIKNRKK